jgi:hypothetical protein
MCGDSYSNVSAPATWNTWLESCCAARFQLHGYRLHQFVTRPKGWSNTYSGVESQSHGYAVVRGYLSTDVGVLHPHTAVSAGDLNPIGRIRRPHLASEAAS